MDTKIVGFDPLFKAISNPIQSQRRVAESFGTVRSVRYTWTFPRKEIGLPMNRNVVLVEGLEPRRMLADDHPFGVSFNDEALWDENFPTAVAQAKSLGITAVRVWLSIDTWDGRPNAWDPLPNWQQTILERDGDYSSSNILAMRRLFDLKDAGFAVMVSLVPRKGQLPESTQVVTDLMTHFKNAKETPGGTRDLADVVDYWEVGNEPDLEFFWAYATSDKSVRIRHYVDTFLIPAATVLKTGQVEKVISAGPAFSPNDLNTILDQLSDRGKLNLIDYAGFHPYGNYVPGSGSNPQKDNVDAAKAVVANYNKEMFATEWNVRGYTNGSRTQWAQALDENWVNVIKPAFKSAFYYLLINNEIARGNSPTSTRPGGLLKHDSPVTNLIGEPYSAWEDWYKTPLIKNDPFYSVYKGWTNSTTPPPPTTYNISGTIYNDTDGDGTRDAGEAVQAGRVVFIDANSNGRYDTGERTATANADGVYTFSGLANGTYRVAREPSSKLTFTAPTSGYHSVTISGASKSGYDFGSKPVAVTPPAPTTQIHPAPMPTNLPAAPKPPAVQKGRGSISGFIFNDTNLNGRYDGSDGVNVGYRVYLDLNRNGVHDRNEAATLTDANGAFQFVDLLPGTYAVRQLFAKGTRLTTLWSDITITAGLGVMGVSMGSGK